MKKKICLVVAARMTVEVFLREQIRALSELYQVTLVVNTVDIHFLEKYGLAVDVIPAEIERKLSPGKDLKALFFLCSLFRKEKYDLVHSVTPKAGLLAMLAGILTGVPVRLHTFTGQVWVTRKGIARSFLKLMDRFLAKLTTHILVDSPSQRQFLLGEGVVSEAKSLVLGQGSISGVDLKRFVPDLQARLEIRTAYSVPENGLVLLYLGRLNRDKGVLDLARAFSIVSGANSDCFLLLVGPDEEELRNIILEMFNEAGNDTDRVRFVNYTSEPEKYMAASDVFCLPSYREGFGSVIIEAAAVGIPAIGTRIYGVTDAIEEGVTGLLYQPGDVAGLVQAMSRLAGDRELREGMGEKARRRAVELFDEGIITSALLEYYRLVLDG